MSRLSRRQLILSAGATALLTPVFRSSRADAATPPIRRLVFFHTPLGSIRESFVCSGSESSFTLSPILKPLTPFKDKLLVIDGLSFGTTGHNHHEMGAMLTGKLCSGADASSKHANISVDQYIRAKLPATLRVKSLELMTFNRNSPLDADRSLFSARGPGLPVIPEGNPQAAFDRVFAGVTPGGGGTTTTPDPALAVLRADRRSVLDLTVKELNSVGSRLSASEKLKLDQHLTAIRELEKRLQEPTAAPTGAGVAACRLPTRMPSVNVFENSSLPARLKADMDIVALGMACDQLRVAVIGNENGQGRASPVWVGYNTNWHDAFTHDKGGRVEHTRIHTWYAEQFAYLVSLFNSIPEGAGTMLDNSTLVMFSEQGCRYLTGGYTHHSPDDLPFVVAGSGGGYFKQNRFVKTGKVSYTGFLFNCLRAMGLPDTSFGNVSGSPIAALEA